MSSLIDLFHDLPSCSSDEDLDKRVWKIAIIRSDGLNKKYYFNKVTRKSLWALPPSVYGRYDDDEVEKAFRLAKNNNTSSLISHFPEVPSLPEDNSAVQVIEKEELGIFHQPPEVEEEGQKMKNLELLICSLSEVTKGTD